MTEPDSLYDTSELLRISEITIGHYDRMAGPYWIGTRDHDVSQNYAALLEASKREPPYSILDLGCGTGKHLHYFESQVPTLYGVDQSADMIRLATQRCATSTALDASPLSTF